MGDDKQFSHIVYDQRGLIFLYLVNMLAWAVGGWLLHFEYIKRLSEGYYTHWLYWMLMFLINFVFLILNFNMLEWYLKTLYIFSLFFNSGLLIMMIITKRRTARHPRPFDYDEEQALLREQMKRRTLKKGSFIFDSEQQEQ